MTVLPFSVIQVIVFIRLFALSSMNIRYVFWVPIWMGVDWVLWNSSRYWSWWFWPNDVGLFSFFKRRRWKWEYANLIEMIKSRNCIHKNGNESRAMHSATAIQVCSSIAAPNGWQDRRRILFGCERALSSHSHEAGWNKRQCPDCGS